MGKLTQLICKGCGGQIDRDTMTCTSCGTQYKYDDDGRLITVVEYSKKVLYINGEIGIPAFYIKDNLEGAMEMSLNELAKEIAKKIIPLTEIQMRFSPETQMYFMHARLGVAEPFEYSRYFEPHYPTFKFGD